MKNNESQKLVILSQVVQLVHGEPEIKIQNLLF